MGFDPPYGVIWNRWQAGRVVPFLGAGASLVGRPPGASWDAHSRKFLPSGVDLARLLADEAEFPSTDDYERNDLAKVSSYYVDIAGREILKERLRSVLNSPYECGPLHEFLAEIPTPQVIVVTNYDTLVEQAFRARGRAYDLVIHPADRADVANAILWWPHGHDAPMAVEANALDIDLSRTTVIYKMHGTVSPETAEWDNFVITEEDYVEFLARMTTNTAIPSLFFPWFRERSFLFLGYSLRDWNLRVVLKNLNRYLESGRTPSWSIQLRPSELDRRLWAKKNVNIFDLNLDDFIVRMRQKIAN